MSAALPSAYVFAKEHGACVSRRQTYRGLSLRQAFTRIQRDPFHADARWALHKMLEFVSDEPDECECRFAEEFFEVATFDMVLEALRAAGRL